MGLPALSYTLWGTATGPVREDDPATLTPGNRVSQALLGLCYLAGLVLWGMFLAGILLALAG